MKIADILNFARIQLDVPATSKKQVLETIAKLATASTGCEQQIIFDALVERERLGTTGIGKGVAIPHARLANLKDFKTGVGNISFNAEGEISGIEAIVIKQFQPDGTAKVIKE